MLSHHCDGAHAFVFRRILGGPVEQWFSSPRTPCPEGEPPSGLGRVKDGLTLWSGEAYTKNR